MLGTEQPQTLLSEEQAGEALKCSLVLSPPKL
jgi:hypothetical protein